MSKHIRINTTSTKYRIIKEVCTKHFGWRPTKSEDWDIFWTDTSIQADRLSQMKHFQKINHFPGMYIIARKNTMAIYLNKLRELFPSDYDFYPRTWILPCELQDFKFKLKKKTFIIKPEASSQGKGIYLVRKPEDLENTEQSVAQRYIDRPFLIDGHKFDLRLYVLVTGCDPLRVFLHEEGLVRLATEPYRLPTKHNLKRNCMHLTNYAVNKQNPNFINNENVFEFAGHKRTLSSFLLHLEATGHDVESLWELICDLVVKTLIVVQPQLAHIYKSCQPNDLDNSHCFEILGFDIMIDYNLKPYLIEVNHSPSFSTDSTLDKYVKARVISEALVLMDITVDNKVKAERVQRDIIRKRTIGLRTFKETQNIISKERKKSANRRNKHESNVDVGYIKIFPCNESYYEQFLNASKDIWGARIDKRRHRSSHK